MDYLRGKLFHFLHNPLTQTFSEFLRHGDRALWMTSPRNVIIMIFEINSISHVSDMYSIVYSSHTNQNTKDPFPLQQNCQNFLNFPPLPLQIVSVSCIYVEC